MRLYNKEVITTETGHKQGVRRISVVGKCYLAADSQQTEDYMHAAVVVR
jgi:hypothetical protein